VDVGYTERNIKGERESRCLIHKEKYKGREGEWKSDTQREI
jgi:hypothetical protein